MRISDWSSDVCSSDLILVRLRYTHHRHCRLRPACSRHSNIRTQQSTARIVSDPFPKLAVFQPMRSLGLHAVKEAGAGFRSIAEPMVDTTSQFAEVVIAVLGIAASYERQRITERTAAGRVQAKARGVKFGRRAEIGRAHV